jgi:hypothetical protein
MRLLVDLFHCGSIFPKKATKNNTLQVDYKYPPRTRAKRNFKCFRMAADEDWGARLTNAQIAGKLLNDSAT